MPIFTLDIFSLHIAPTWYGLMYAIGFLSGYLIIRSRKILPENDLDNLLLFVFFGVILGWRLGYVLFYDLSHYLEHPVDIVKTWNGWMSFHGGAIGVIVAMWLFSRKYHLSFLRIADEVTLVLPIGIGLGRIGNYINGELVGYAPYSGPFAMMREDVAHFPSPLLESLFEGIVLLTILFLIARWKKFPGQIASSFLVGYGSFRVVSEFFRLPDPQIGYLFGDWLTMGHLLSLPMVIIGIILLFVLNAQHVPTQK